jgi:hypothetical protein
MSEHRCWITYKNDRSLQSRKGRGDFGDGENVGLPIDSFPPPPGNNDCWTAILKEWSRENGIKFVDEGLKVSAKVKKNQIEDFIEYVYARDPFYFEPAKMLTWKGRAYLANSLTNLRAFVAQELNSRLWYEITADEW